MHRKMCTHAQFSVHALSALHIEKEIAPFWWGFS